MGVLAVYTQKTSFLFSNIHNQIKHTPSDADTHTVWQMYLHEHVLKEVK